MSTQLAHEIVVRLETRWFVDKLGFEIVDSDEGDDDNREENAKRD